MNELSTHIEYLLLTHQCVVVPHFGAFMAMTTPAARDDEENRFFPPLRMVRFNANITANDGLLIASIAQAHGLTADEARKRVQQYVFQLRSTLLSEGQVDFGALGVFTQDEDGHIDFSACLAGAMTPAFYGLDAFVMPRAERSNNKSIARAHRRRTIEHTDSDSHIIIHISRRALRRTIITAAAAVVCALLCLPLYDSTNAPAQQAAILPHSTQPTPAPATSAVSTAASAATPSTSSTASATAPALSQYAAAERQPQSSPSAASPSVAVEPQPQPSSVPSSTPVPAASSFPRGFAVVLASATSTAGANDLIARMKRMGYDNARLYNNGRMNRVVLDGYATEAEALNAKHELQWHHDGFDDAWLLRP